MKTTTFLASWPSLSHKGGSVRVEADDHGFYSVRVGPRGGVYEPKLGEDGEELLDRGTWYLVAGRVLEPAE